MKKSKLLLLMSLLLISACSNGDNSSTSSSDELPDSYSSEEISLDFSSDIDSDEPSSSLDEPISPSSNEEESLSSSSQEEVVIPEGYQEIEEGLYVSHLPGIYDRSFNLDFFIPNENYKLYYTKNGNNPQIKLFNEYNTSIKIKKYGTSSLSTYPMTTSVDGILAGYGSDKCSSSAYNNNIQTNGNYYLLPKQTILTITLYDTEKDEPVFTRTLSYIIDEDNIIDIPVVSLTMPYDDWFGEDNGFYNKIKDDMKKRAHLEYYDPEYNEYFYRNTQAKLGGNWTVGYPQRTINLNFNKNENGKKNKAVDAHIFKEKKKRGSDSEERLDKFTRIRLHNGGNCFEESVGFNDALLQAMMEDDPNVSTTGYRPCITYFNGEYWGLYAIREHYKNHYFADHYDVDKDDVLFYELKGSLINSDGDEDLGTECINELNEYLKKDFTNDDVYQTFIDEYIDVDSFIDVVVANAYGANWDFLGNFNNLKMWRTYNVDDTNPYADGKWRFVMHDSDFVFRENTNFLDKNHGNSYSKFNLMQKLLSNESFRDRFYERAEYLTDGWLNYDNGSEILMEMVDEIKYFKLDSARRWGQGSNYIEDQWTKEITNVKNMLRARDKDFMSSLRQTLNQYKA